MPDLPLQWFHALCLSVISPRDRRVCGRGDLGRGERDAGPILPEDEPLRGSSTWRPVGFLPLVMEFTRVVPKCCCVRGRSQKQLSPFTRQHLCAQHGFPRVILRAHKFANGQGIAGHHAPFLQLEIQSSILLCTALAFGTTPRSSS